MSSSQFETSSLSVSGNGEPPAGARAAARPDNPRDVLSLPEQMTSRRRNKRRWVLALLAIAGLIAAYFAFGRSSGADNAYRVSPAERRDIRQTVEAFGSLDVLSRVYVPAPRPGQLNEIYVRRGEMVEAGQPLAKLDATGATAELNAAQTALTASAARVDRARATRASASEERARAARLLEKGLVSAGSVTAAKAKETEAVAELRAAEAQRDLEGQQVGGARLRRDETTLRAPVSGFVLSAAQDVGGMVGPQSEPLFVISPPLTLLLLAVPVSEADIGLVRKGQHAVFSVSAHAGRTFEAQIDQIDSEPQRAGSAVSYRVRLQVKNPEGLLLPGMTANVTLQIAEARDTLAVREAALRFRPSDVADDATRSRVWRLKPEGALEPVDVVVGLSDGAYTAVTPAAGAQLGVGDPVAVGLAGGSAPRSTKGPGISLGSKQ